jgi:transposase
MLYQRGRAYSQDLRERVFAASDDGDRVGEVAELLRVSVAYVSKALTRRRKTGETTVRSRRGQKPPKLAPFYAAIREHVAERRDITIEELLAWLLATHQVAASVGLIWHTLKLLGLTLKKSRSGQPSRIGRTSRRLVWSGVRPSRRLIRAG